jgi:hypothetical protein
MANASFVQTSFLGGEWSPRAQGRMTDQTYKTAMANCHNGYPTEEGAWIRRPGFRYLAHTRGGQAAKLIAFDFTITQPYQIEFTPLKARLFAGLSLLTTLNEDNPVAIFSVTTTNPAKVYLSSAIPSGWSNGDTIIFKLQVVPCIMPALLNRQFLIADLSTSAATFTLKDAITGEYVDATGYETNTGGDEDNTVEKIFELTTVYTSSLLQGLRLVSRDEDALVLCTGFKPYLLEEGSPWTLTKQDFQDGPYFDLNETATTMVCSATSGSVTVIASSAIGINEGQGFLNTDVGRLIRLKSAPAEWASGSTYKKDDVVSGSDENIYNSVAGSNIGNDPTTDDGSHWEVTSETLQWCWLTITAVTNNLQVTATVEAPVKDSTDSSVDAPTTPTADWRLGLYSDTTGYPTCGCYHEGRLWLSSSAFGNRVDASVSNKPFNFSPTDTNGSVAASNAIAATANAKDVNYFFWMVSTEDGLSLGSQSGEWRIRASSLDDPISPTSIQMRRVSNWGCADTEPAQASLNVFVQRHRRKLMAHQQVNDQKYTADNLSHLADHLVADGIEQIAWQQEPALTIWNRLTSGSLVGMVYQKDLIGNDSFNAFFSTEFGDGRTVESISAGPTYDGLSTTLYVVSNQTDSDAPDHNVRWVQSMMPAFDSSSKDWEAYLTDGGANPSYMKRMSVANGDGYDGIRIYGLWNLNGRSFVPVLGGLDLGDRTVTNGYCNVAFSSDPDKKFTFAFFDALNDGTDYGVFEAQAGYVVHTGGGDPAVEANTLLAYVGEDGDVTGSDNFTMHLDPVHNKCIEVLRESGTNQGLCVFNASTGVETAQASPATTFPTITGPAWVSTDTLAKYHYGYYVTGSDGNVYQAIQSYGNLAYDPISYPFRWHGIGANPVQPDWQNCLLSYLHSNGFLYAQVFVGGSTFGSPIYKINTTTLVVDRVAGCNDPYASNSGYNYPAAGGYTKGEPTFTLARINFAEAYSTNRIGNLESFLVYCGQTSATQHNEVVCVNADNLNFIASCYTNETPQPTGTNQAAHLDEDTGSVCTAENSIVFMAGSPRIYSGTENTIGLYRAFIGRYLTNEDWDPVLRINGWAAALRIVKIRKIEPADIDAEWTAWTDVAGPAYDKSDGNIIMVYTGKNSGTDSVRIVKHNASTGATIWTASIAGTKYGYEYVTNRTMSIMDVRGRIVFFDTSRHLLYVIDTADGTITTQTINSGFITTTATTALKLWDPTTSSITFWGSFTPPGTGPAVTCVGDYLPAHSNTLSNQWGRFYAGLVLDPVTTITAYSVPISVGATFTSTGQLLRPDYGVDAGAQNGPAFGKLRRLHKWAGSFWKTRGLSIGTDIDGQLYPVMLRSPGKIVLSVPNLFSGIISDTINNDDSYNAQIAWKVTRPYPVTILAMGGYISLADK